MSFDPGSELDPSQIRDRAGRERSYGRAGRGRPGHRRADPGACPDARRNGGGGAAIDVLNQLSGLNGQQVGEPGQLGHGGQRVSHRSGCPANAGLPDRRLREQHPGLLVEGASRLHGGADGVLQRPDRDRVRRGVVARWARSTARPTRTSTSTWGSSRSSAPRFGAQGRAVRPGLRPRPRIRAPRAGPAGNPEDGRRRPGSSEPERQNRAASRLLRRSVGRARRRAPAS